VTVQLNNPRLQSSALSWMKQI